MYTRHRLLIPLLGCFFAACTNVQKKRIWHEYLPDDKQFRFIIPDGFDTGSEQITDPVFGNLKEQYWVWRIARPFHISMVEETDIKSVEVSFIDLPSNTQKAEQILDTCVERHLRAYTGKIAGLHVPVTHTAKSGFPGIYMVAEIDAGKSANRICYIGRYLAHDRLYKLRVVAYKGHHRQSEVDSFFKSFVILN